MSGSSNGSVHFAGSYEASGLAALVALVEADTWRVVNKAQATTTVIVLGLDHGVPDDLQGPVLKTPATLRRQYGQSCRDDADLPLLALSIQEPVCELPSDDAIRLMRDGIERADLLPSDRARLDAVLDAALLCDAIQEPVTFSTTAALSIASRKALQAIKAIYLVSNGSFAALPTQLRALFATVTLGTAGAETAIEQLGGLYGVEMLLRLVYWLALVKERLPTDVALGDALLACAELAETVTSLIKTLSSSGDTDQMHEDDDVPESLLTGLRVHFKGTQPRDVVLHQEWKVALISAECKLIDEPLNPRTDVLVYGTRVNSAERALYPQFQRFELQGFLDRIGFVKSSELVRATAGIISDLGEKRPELFKARKKPSARKRRRGDSSGAASESDSGEGPLRSSFRLQAGTDARTDDEDVDLELQKVVAEHLSPELRKIYLSVTAPGQSQEELLAEVTSAMTVDELGDYTQRHRAAEKAASGLHKGREKAYAAHQQRYLDYMAEHLPSIPALPVRPAAAYMFFKYSATRPQYVGGRGRKGIFKEGTTLGSGALRQIINALEYLRKETAHYFGDVSDSQIALRTDRRISDLEKGAELNDVVREAKSQSVKGAGTGASALTLEQTGHVAVAFAQSGSRTAKHKMAAALRDWHMYLVSMSYAFRGDNVRYLCMSDLHFRESSRTVGQQRVTLSALHLFARRGKTNKDGHTDQVAALRAREVLTCPVGAIARQLWVVLELLEGYARLNFAPEFSDEASQAGYGKYGRRLWWLRLLFPASSETAPMAYSTHANAIKKILNELGIVVEKKTHLGRYGVVAKAQDASVADGSIRQHGLWKGDQYQKCYAQAMPFDAMLALADFDKDRPELYFIPRGAVDVPQELKDLFFPWLETEQREYEARVRVNPNCADYALGSLFELLRQARSILCQDAALMLALEPEPPFLSHAPFNSPVFREWAPLCRQRCDEIEVTMRHSFVDLPPQLMEGVTTLLAAQQAHTDKRFDELVGMVKGLVVDRAVAARALPAPVRSGTTVGTDGVVDEDDEATARLFESGSLVRIIDRGTPVLVLGKAGAQAALATDKRFDEMRDLDARYGARIAPFTFCWKGTPSPGCSWAWVPAVDVPRLAYTSIADAYGYYTVHSPASVEALPFKEIEQIWASSWRLDAQGHADKTPKNLMCSLKALHDFVVAVARALNTTETRVVRHLADVHTVKLQQSAKTFGAAVSTSRGAAKKANKGLAPDAFSRQPVFGALYESTLAALRA